MATKQDPKSKQSASQQDDQKHNQSDTSSKAVAADRGANDDTQALESLLETLSGDLSSIDTDAALGAIDEWHGLLQKAKEPELKELAGGLKELKQLLKGGKATGHDIGEVLSHIGDQTSDIAADADKGVKTSLQKLGKQLSKAGQALGKAEDREAVEQIESLSETLQGDLTEVDTDTAVGAIDHWYGLLHKSDNESLKEISNGLKELKQILKRKNANASDIAEALTQLGEQTSEAASEAHRGLKGPIQKFGKLLSKTGKSLE
ncbi:MAG: hypothetical protein KME45_15995 [Stenomitos rutilans HA7619-LM2]|jgi:DNA-binding PucR family transcriptional regulator|nr:hypothetical protein [Stenomitos rutilans HA7619-LM2]